MSAWLEDFSPYVSVESSVLYTQPFVINETSTARAVAFRDGKKVCLESEGYFVRLPGKHQMPDVFISDLEPIRGLTNLQILGLSDINISNLEPIKDLKNLCELSLSLTDEIDLEPLKELINLKDLNVIQSKIKKEKIEDLQKALPKLRIHENMYDVRASYF